MAKEKEKQLARILYIQQCKTAKEISRQVGVEEKTIGKWVKEGAWKEERDARKNSIDTLESNLREVIASLTEQRITLERDSNSDPREKVQLADQISKWSKALESVKKERKVHLSVYIEVMESIFSSLRIDHPEIFMKLIDFQEKHINEMARKLV